MLNLHWLRAKSTVQIEGGGTITDFYSLSDGEIVPLEVYDHSADADFHWAEAPQVAYAPGALFLLDVSNTTGSQIRLVVMRIGGDGYETGDLDYTWTRRGGLK